MLLLKDFAVSLGNPKSNLVFVCALVQHKERVQRLYV